jgi:hypothetical protein
MFSLTICLILPCKFKDQYIPFRGIETLDKCPMTRPELYGDLTRWQGNPIKKDISGKKTKKNRHCDVIKQQISTRIFLTYQCYQVSKRVIKIIFLKKLFKNIFK